MKPCFAWMMADPRNPNLLVQLLLTDRYFTVGTDWIDTGDDVKWYTYSFDTVDKAHAFAVQHTVYLEIGGDKIKRGPFAAEIGEHVFLDELVGHDRTSARLDHLYDHVMDTGKAA